MEFLAYAGPISAGVSLLTLVFTWVKGGFKKSFDAEALQAKVETTVGKVAQLEKLTDRVKNLEQSHVEMKRNYSDNNGAIIMKLDDINKSMNEMNRALGRLEGKAGHG